MVRVEDWLRADPRLAAASNDRSKQELRDKLLGYVGSFVSHLEVAASRGTIFLLCAPSRGHVSVKYGLELLCATFGNLLEARAGEIANVELLSWRHFRAMSLLAEDDVDDVSGDRMGQVPFTQECFDELGTYLGEHIARRINADGRSYAKRDGADKLATFLRTLRGELWWKRSAPEEYPILSEMSRLGDFRTRKDFWTVGAIGAVVHDPERELAVLRYRDRFGDYGISGFVVFAARHDVLAVESLILICPILGKQAEHAILLLLARAGRRGGCSRILFAKIEHHAPGDYPAYQLLSRVANEAGPVAVEDSEGLSLPLDRFDEAVRRCSAAEDVVLGLLDSPRNEL